MGHSWFLMTAIVFYTIIGCVQRSTISDSKKNTLSSIPKVISPITARYDMTYRENHTGILKRASVQYESEAIWPCLISIYEKVKVTNIEKKTEKRYLNTYQLSLADTNPRLMAIKKVTHKTKNRITPISGDRHQYALSLHYHYQNNALIPSGQLVLSAGKIDSSKVKMVHHLKIRFANKNHALATRKVLQNAITRCAKNTVSRLPMDVEPFKNHPSQ